MDNSLYTLYFDLAQRLARIERGVFLLMRAQKIEERQEMATQAALDALTASVKANTDGVASAAAALTGFVQTVADLQTQLQAAIDGGDDAAVQAAADAIAANNATLTAAVPAVAAAVVAST